MAKRKTSSSAPPAASRAATVASGEDWSIFRHISWWALLAMVFITPLIISNWSLFGFSTPITYDQFDIIKLFTQRVLGIVALAAWVWDMAVRGGKIRHTPVDWLVLAFLAWVTLSTVFSIHPPTALFGKYRRFEGLLSFINYAVIYFLVLQMANRSLRIRQLAQSLFWSGLLVAGYGIMQSLGSDPLEWGQLPFEANRAFSTYGNPDLLGGFLMFSTFISLGLALAEPKVPWRIVYWSGFLLSVWCVIVAFTRSAWVGASVGIFFIVLFAIRQRAPWTVVDWGFSAVVGAVASVVIGRSLANPNEVMNFGKRIVSIFQFTEGSAATRFQIWGAAWRAVQDRPILGFGADTFRLLFPKYKPVEYVAAAGYLSVADNVHNYPLQLASGIGIPGVLGFYGIMGWTAVRTWPLVWARGRDANRMVLAGIWAACAAYIVHLLFGLSVTGSSFLLWTFAAVLLAPTATSITLPRLSWGLIVAVVVSILALVGIWFQFVYISADNAYLQSRIVAQDAQRTELAQRAARLNPYNDIYRAEVGVAATDEFIAVLNSGGTRDEAEAAFGRAEAALLDTIAFVPPEYDNYVFLSNLYNIAGEVLDPAYFAQAEQAGLDGVAVERYGPAIRVQLARALIGQKRYDEAEQHLAYAVKMDPMYDQAAITLASVYKLQGRTTEAIELLRRYPNSAEAVAALQALEASESATP